MCILHAYTCNWVQLGQIRTQIAYTRVWGALFRTAGTEGEGRDGHTLWKLVAGEGPDEHLPGKGRRPVVS
jgi:hypothetical protein